MGETSGVSHFNVTGATIVFLMGLLIGILLFTGLSWIKMLRYLLSCLKPRLRSVQPAPNTKIKIPLPKVIPPVAKEEVKMTSVTLGSTPPTEERMPSHSSAKKGWLDRLLDKPVRSKPLGYSETRLQELSHDIEVTLKEFGIEAKVVAVLPGPVITRFELELAPGLKASRVTSLAKDLARSLSQSSVRVVEVIPGKAVIGLEIPNECREIVHLREMFELREYSEFPSLLNLMLGKSNT